MQGDLFAVNSLHIPLQLRVSRQIATIVHWRKPQEGWYKLNTDGASNVNQGISGARGILRDYLGRVILAFQEPLRTTTNTQAELRLELELGTFRTLSKASGNSLARLTKKSPTYFEKAIKQRISLPIKPALHNNITFFTRRDSQVRKKVAFLPSFLSRFVQKLGKLPQLRCGQGVHIRMEKVSNAGNAGMSFPPLMLLSTRTHLGCDSLFFVHNDNLIDAHDEMIILRCAGVGTDDSSVVAETFEHIGLSYPTSFTLFFIVRE
ncbi:hypothetical protein Sango_0360500 [Sesamum angolense]|uniref:RNase H type-1 domain-containing protein n=1 Tax=Sesamum angolense TaxID=2727404 RepID=A0AAE2C3Y0_9LAMI|nr:hypothetical protein Sango_0360500 [Sesamum angolense]